MQYLNTKRFSFSILNMSFLLLLIISGATFANTQLYLNNSKTVYLQGSELTWFNLPIGKRYSEIKLTISADDQTLFYPIITLYDRFKNARTAIRAPINLTHIGPYKEGIVLRVPFNEYDTFMSIHTPKDLVGQQFSIARGQNTIIPVMTNNGTYYVPSATNEKLITYTLVDSGFVELTLPMDSGENPEYGQNGWFVDFANNFGGDKIATNPGGDDYKAGGGVLMLFGYDKALEGVPNVSYQLSGGFRYQGAQIGKGENFGVVSQLAVDYDFGLYHAGVGIQLDTLNYNKNELGQKTEFDDTVSPFIKAEWEVEPWLNITASYLFADYKDEYGKSYKGNQFGLGIRFKQLEY